MSSRLSYLWSKMLKHVHSPALRNCLIDNTAYIGPGSNCINVSMGRYSYMGDNNSISYTQIGSFCSIASGCSIGGGVHPISAVSSSPVFYKGRNVLHKNFASLDKPRIGKVVIGNDVWIGEKAFIKDGISIGDGAIVGAHAVVTHDIPAYAIVAGVPAKVIRYRFDNEVIEKLIELKWWNWDEAKLRQCGNFFDDPIKLIYKGNIENV